MHLKYSMRKPISLKDCKLLQTQARKRSKKGKEQEEESLCFSNVKRVSFFHNFLDMLQIKENPPKD